MDNKQRHKYILIIAVLILPVILYSQYIFSYFNSLTDILATIMYILLIYFILIQILRLLDIDPYDYVKYKLIKKANDHSWLNALVILTATLSSLLLFSKISDLSEKRAYQIYTESSHITIPAIVKRLSKSSIRGHVIYKANLEYQYNNSTISRDIDIYKDEFVLNQIINISIPVHHPRIIVINNILR